MGEKRSRPWGFGLSGGKGGKGSMVVFVIVLLVGLLTQVGGWGYGALKERRERPALAMKSLLRDVRSFIRSERRVPVSFKELETKIWNQSGPGSARQLPHGDNVLVMTSYEYFYFAGKDPEGVEIVNLWAIPLGKYRDEYDSLLMIIKTDGEDVWRGPALTVEQREIVLKKNLGLSLSDMSALNMKKDSVPGPSPGSGKGFNIFN